MRIFYKFIFALISSSVTGLFVHFLFKAVIAFNNSWNLPYGILVKINLLAITMILIIGAFFFGILTIELYMQVYESIKEKIRG